jgi:tRNA-specific 2-thiouridylase
MRVAAHLRIQFKEIDLSEAYQKRVFDYTLSAFAAGRTPNPDTLCNREIKFGLFFEWARAQGANFVATGHYARTQVLHGEAHLYAGVDTAKDQSYFLYMIPEGHLGHVLFPVGGYTKPEVRSLAQSFNLPNATRKDSQGLCFLGDISIQDMLKRELVLQKGRVLSTDGTVIGEHEGASRYTIGQRHGFTVAGHSSETQAQYVIAKNVADNTITVSPNQTPHGSTKTKLIVSELNWIGEVTNGTYLARFRYRQTLIPATLTLTDDGALVELVQPHYAPEGQSVVLYTQDATGLRCLGGGVIQKVQIL